MFIGRGLHHRHMARDRQTRACLIPQPYSDETKVCIVNCARGNNRGEGPAGGVGWEGKRAGSTYCQSAAAGRASISESIQG